MIQHHSITCTYKLMGGQISLPHVTAE